MVSKALFSSAKEEGTDDWGTPQEFFDAVNRLLSFDLDVCATPNLAKCKKYFSPEQNGLLQPWAPFRCWMNPPYSENLLWVTYAEREGRRGALVAGLVPSRTDTEWWHTGAKYARYILLIEGRLTFDTGASEKNPAPFPSALLLWTREELDPEILHALESFGHLIDQSYRFDSQGRYIHKDDFYQIYSDSDDEWWDDE